MGVYAIRDKASGKVKVRSSRNVPAAIHRTLFELRLGTHLDQELQAAWSDGGTDRVSLEVVDMLRERDDPCFDYSAELQMLEQLHREALCQGLGA